MSSKVKNIQFLVYDILDYKKATLEDKKQKLDKIVAIYNLSKEQNV